MTRFHYEAGGRRSLQWSEAGRPSVSTVAGNRAVQMSPGVNTRHSRVFAVAMTAR